MSDPDDIGDIDIDNLHKIERLEVENKRLREALEGISQSYYTNPSLALADLPEADYLRIALGEIRAAAKAALEDTDK